MEKELSIRPLHADDVGALADLLAGEAPDYLAHFHPFPFDSASLRARVDGSRKDRYWALLVTGKLAGFFMLRGFDSGYARPAFGVYVASAFARQSLARLALQFSMTWCALNGVGSVMLKVHPENTAARRVYVEAGFVADRICPDTGHEMFVWQASIRR